MAARAITTVTAILCWETMTKMTIHRKPHMNRVYITGNVDPIRTLLSDFQARHDSAGWWLPIYQEAKLRSAIAAEDAYQATIAVAQKGWDEAKAVIPSDYRTRHGAAFGGTVRINGEAITEPGLDTSRLPWQHVVTHEKRVRDLTGQSSINGRVMDSEALYRAVTEDGRPIYRVAHSSGFGDDLRETYYLPPDLWERLMRTEVAKRGITCEIAEAWLAESRGCVGTELYEFALSAGPTPTIGLQSSTALFSLETEANRGGSSPGKTLEGK